MYTYESPELGDLTFREGDLILVSKRDGEWWHGSIGGSSGVFPSNYVKPKEADVRTLNTSRYKREKNTVAGLLLYIRLLYIVSNGKSYPGERGLAASRPDITTNKNTYANISQR